MDDQKNYPNEAIEAVAEALEEWGLSEWAEGNLISDLKREMDNRRSERDEAAYQAHQDSLMESGGLDDTSYRKAMTDAGRADQLR